MKYKYCLFQPDRKASDIIRILAQFGGLSYQHSGCLWFVETDLTMDQMRVLLPLKHIDDHIMEIKYENL